MSKKDKNKDQKPKKRKKVPLSVSNLMFFSIMLVILAIAQIFLQLNEKTMIPVTVAPVEITTESDVGQVAEVTEEVPPPEAEPPVPAEATPPAEIAQNTEPSVVVEKPAPKKKISPKKFPETNNEIFELDGPDARQKYLEGNKKTIVRRDSY